MSGQAWAGGGRVVFNLANMLWGSNLGGWASSRVPQLESALAFGVGVIWNYFLKSAG